MFRMFTQNFACPQRNGLVGIDGKGTIQERGVTRSEANHRVTEDTESKQQPIEASVSSVILWLACVLA
jgi:hypothetical protein